MISFLTTSTATSPSFIVVTTSVFWVLSDNREDALDFCLIVQYRINDALYDPLSGLNAAPAMGPFRF